MAKTALALDKPQFAPQPPVCWLCGNRHNLHPVQYYTGGQGYSWSQECRDQAACEARWREGGVMLTPTRSLLTASQAAELMGCHPETVRRLTRDGALASVARGNRRLVARADVEALSTAGRRTIVLTREQIYRAIETGSVEVEV